MLRMPRAEKVRRRMMGHGSESGLARSTWPPKAMTKPGRWWEAVGFLSRVGWEPLNGFEHKRDVV